MADVPSLEGTWFSKEPDESLQMRGVIRGKRVELPNGDVVYCKEVTATSLEVVFEGDTYSATMQSDGDMLKWSDGDVWIRAFREEMKLAFKQADKDGNGTIDRHELAALFPLGDWSKEDLDAMFAVVDRDGSGAIDYNEFVDWIMADPSAEPKASQ